MKQGATITATNKNRPEQRPKPKSRAYKWEVSEQAPRKPWWWWVALSYATFFLVWWTWSQGWWSLAILIAVIALTLIYTYASASRHFRYRLSGASLVATRNKSESRLDLIQFKQAYIDDPWVSSRNVSSTVILVLIPKARLAPARNVLLPVEEKKRERVIDLIASHVSILRDQEVNSYRQGQRILSWLARKIGL